MPPVRRLPAFLVFFSLFTAVGYAASVPRAAAAGDGPPVLTARSAILIEAVTGTVLFEHQADEPIPPASLTKLMTIHLALTEIEEGRLSTAETLIPSPESWARNMPPRSSLMYLGPGQKLTVDQLLTGLVVDSGNDAAVEVAERIAGSVPAFVAMMNREAARLGYPSMHFVEPAGISAANTVTAREYAAFARVFVQLHPEALKEYFSVREFTYPLPGNLTGGNREKPVTQSNRNLLLGAYEGVDGLKTGYIDESGYNIAVTAERGGMRLIAVLLGVPDAGRVSGAVRRAEESAALLDYGYETFLLVRPAYPAPAAPRVWKGTARTVGLTVRPTPFIVVRKDQASQLRTSLEQDLDVEAPFSGGQRLGDVVVSLGSREIARFPLVAAVGVGRGGFLRRALDSVALFVRGVAPVRFPPRV
jgi:D-alanyl-D-alanine carboxypeptidase (penicillin-binding protein 5/6)